MTAMLQDAPTSTAALDDLASASPDDLAALDKACMSLLDWMGREHEARRLLAEHKDPDKVKFPDMGAEAGSRLEFSRLTHDATTATWTRVRLEHQVCELFDEVYPDAPEPARSDYEGKAFKYQHCRAGDFTVVRIRETELMYLDHRGRSEG